MTKKLEIYKCEICGNIVEILHPAKGELYCCGKPMINLKEQTADTSTEKHVPFVNREANSYIVKVGENTEHPMTEEHYIEWIELSVDGTIYKKFLNPSDKPEAIFEVPEGNIIKAREMCNIHGVWSK